MFFRIIKNEEDFWVCEDCVSKFEADGYQVIDSRNNNHGDRDCENCGKE